jgi:CBS domain containing-hemolysin-like protein
MISSDAKIDRHLIKIILDSGHSRIPVYAGNRR